VQFQKISGNEFEKEEASLLLQEVLKLESLTTHSTPTPTTPITQKTQSPLVVATSVSPTLASMQAQLAAFQASQTPLS